MKKFLLLAVLMLLTVGMYAQPFQWTYQSDFSEISQPHGIVVDHDGKLWVAAFSFPDTLNGTPVAGIRVYNPDGSETAFSPILTITVGGVTDTLVYGNRGLSVDNNGNILTCNGFLYRLNASDGTGMNIYKFNDAVNSLTEAACDANGFIYVTRVVPGGDPIVILDSDFNLYNFALDSTSVISRSLVVSPDGKDLYHGGIYPAAGAIHYHSDDGPDGQYTTVDTLLGPNPFYELWGQILDWDPNGNLWIGSYWDTAPLAYRGWYAIDPANNFAFVDSIGTTAGDFNTGPKPPVAGTYYSPRGIAFREDPAMANGWYAFTADFDGGVIKQWHNDMFTGIIQVDNGNLVGIKDFELSQNYPNPFNPTTAIPFVLAKAAQVELKVYNVAGQLVTTLVNERMSAGRYEYEFNGTGLASGIYFYQLFVDGKVQSKRMTLTK